MNIITAINDYISHGIVIHPLSMPDNNQKSCKGEVPVLNEWFLLTESINLERFVTQRPAGSPQEFYNVGLVTGNRLPDGKYLSAIDINVYDETKKEIFQNLVRVFHIERPVWQETASQGIQMFIRTDRPFSTSSVMIGDETSSKRIKLLSTGNIVVLAPSKAMGKDGVEREYVMHDNLWEAPLVSSGLIDQFFDPWSNIKTKARDRKNLSNEMHALTKQIKEERQRSTNASLSQQLITTDYASIISPTHQNVIC